jgi:hypothetical protein
MINVSYFSAGSAIAYVCVSLVKSRKGLWFEKNNYEMLLMY